MSKSQNSLTVDLTIDQSNYGKKLKIKFEHPDSRIRMHAVPSNLTLCQDPTFSHIEIPTTTSQP